MINNNKIIVISGLSACGKTTLLNDLRLRYGAFLAPSSSSLRDKSRNFNDISPTLEENIEKQRYYFELDKKVSSIAQNARNDGKLVMGDRDFLSALAHNYAVHQKCPQKSVYPWMVNAYSQALTKQELVIPDLHIFLDVSIEERLRRKNNDPERFRDDCFFESIFSRNMRNFYQKALQTIPSKWIDYNSKDGIKDVFSEIERAEKLPQPINPTNLINFLQDTVNDKKANSLTGNGYHR